MDVNIIAVMSATLMALKKMEGRHGCKIVNIASMAGIVPGSDKESLPYTVSKTGVVSLSRTLAANKEQHGVDFLCLCPSWADTNIVSSIDPRHKPKADRMIKKMGGLLPPERVGEAFMALLASENGSVIGVLAETPIVEFFDISFPRVMLTVVVARLLSRMFGLKIVRKKHLVGALLCLLVLVQLCINFIF